jgi:Asp-tRNA(Asn)/Glu-tRNA(Gln) amidotransferase A subunit family amidase
VPASEFGAFWALVPDETLAAASELDGPLAGATVAVKDCFDVAGLPTTCGVAREWPAAQVDSEAVRRLRRAGAVPLGKAAMDQLAWSTFALAPGFPDCRNPLDPRLTPGGSSCGPAAAVAGGLARLGLGTDDAGSIRVPAACCGVVGLMPPPGWISLDGAASFAPSFDRGGLLARSLEDCVTATEAIAGLRVPAPREGSVRVALIEDLVELADPVVAAAVEEAARALAATGAELVGVRLELQPPPGMGKVLATELNGAWGDRVRAEPELYDDEVKASIAYAERLSDEDRASARRQLGEGRGRLERRLAGCSVALSPTLPWPAPPQDGHPSIAEMTSCTRPFNALGWAALSLPSEPATPIGIQLAAPAAELGSLLRLAGVLAD